MMFKTLIITMSLVGTANASFITIGANGINSAGLKDFQGSTLTGVGIGIGQVEPHRPGHVSVGDDAAHRNSTIDPAAVAVRDDDTPTPNDPATVQDHAEWVAGVMISTHATRAGVAVGASLYASATDPTGPNLDAEAAVTAQYIATRNAGDVRAINMSFSYPLMAGRIRDGNQLLTQFVDWSASQHDALYVVTLRDNTNPIGNSIPGDNFNGMTVAASSQVGGVYRRVAAVNGFTEPPAGERTTVSLVAPGDNVELTGLGNVLTVQDGTSFAAPHVTGTVALLQQYAEERILHAPSALWGANARHHELMKAVLMNSADKIIDDGTYILPGESTPLPRGRLLGMERTVLKQQRPGTPPPPLETWFDSEAYDDSIEGQGQFTPLDDQMGTGHLNAKRALTQFRTGEFNSDAADVPAVGWDYGTTTGVDDINRYPIAGSLRGGSFISITLAWDRQVTFATDTAPTNIYNSGDSFAPYVDNGIDPPDDSVINDLSLYLLPKSGAIGQAIAASISNVGTVEHLFFQIPNTDEYEFWVVQEDDDIGTNQNYAVAWWAAPASLVTQGDFNNNGVVNGADLTQWRNNFGPNNAAGDADGDGDSDGADFQAWQQGLGTTSATATSAAVPEPAAWLLAALDLPLLCRRRAN